jgi:HEXXH motif-containing protein
LRPHLLRDEDFVALAAGDGGDGVVARLRASELSWRKAALWLLLRTLREHGLTADPLPPIDEALELLDRAARTAPHAVDAVLRHPPAGIWAMHTLRRLGGLATSTRPLWIDLGYLHGLAAAAAIRAELDFRMKITVADGGAALPTLGYAWFPPRAAWDCAEVQGAGGAAWLRYAGDTSRIAGDGPDATVAWHPLRRLEASTPAHTLRIVIEDGDPFRDLRSPTPAGRLAQSAVEHWQTMLSRAWDILLRTRPERASAIAEGLTSIIPAPRAERFRPLSASADDAFGTALISEPDDATQLAVALVHEFQHNKLGALLHSVAMYRSGVSELFYAPWRDDPRPLGGVLQGLYAFIGITEFWAVHRGNVDGVEARLAQFEFGLWRQQISLTLRTVRRSAALTESGVRLLDGLAPKVDALNAMELPAGARRLADLAAGDHRAQWRTYHVRPSAVLLSELVRAWRAGAPRPRALPFDGEVISDNTAGRWLDARAVLMRRWLEDEHALRALVGRGDAIGRPEDGGTSGARVADGHLVCGGHDAAREAFLAQLERVPGDAWAWTGLRLLRAMRADPPPDDILHHRPELVRAMHSELARLDEPVSPLALVAWLN